MAINLDVHGNTQPLEAAVQSAINRIRRQPIKISVDDKGATQPLGNMKRAADEFSKSMEAANARIIAFGASMAIINGMADAFKGMVRNMVEVEKALADINVVMGLSAKNLDAFSDGLFKVAKETGQAFKIAADAATEYARQGLSVEESLKRTKDALILTRLTGMDSAEAVKSLTAAMNTYGNQIKDTTQLVSKFAAVDVKFAVSAEDFADAIARTGAAAKGAGVNIDELIGLVTAAQQQTARGGKVIGNSFKTIFTRIGRTDTLNQLEDLGIAVRDIEGKTLGAKRILTDLANTFDHLSEAQKAQIAQTVGGVFQINVLKAVLGDAAKQNGILANATQISAGATTEAIDKNEQLRNTMAAMASETGNAIKQVSAQIGELMLAPGIEKVLNLVKSGAEGLSAILGDGEDSGNKFANGFLKGLGNVISGPGLVIITAVFGKLFLKAASFAKESLTSLIGVTSEAQKQKAIQTSLVGLFGRSSELTKEMLRTDISRTEKEKIILGLLKMQVSEAKALDAVAKSTASTLYSKGFGANLVPRRGRAYGHIPNFAHPEREQAARGGYAAGNIRSMNMPGEGSVIYNSAETVKNFAGFKQPAIMPPQSSKAGQNYQQAFGNIHGFDPYAAGGYIPNYAKSDKGSIVNKDKKMVVFAASLDRGGKYAGINDDLNNIFSIKEQGGGFKLSSDPTAKGFSRVNVPYFGISKKDTQIDQHKDFQSLINGRLIEAGQKVAGEIAAKILGKNYSIRDLKESDVAAASGNIFEAAIMALQGGIAQKAREKDPGGTALLDIPRAGRDKLWEVFGAEGFGGLGAEAKIALGGAGKIGSHLKSAAEKFYKIEKKGKDPFAGRKTSSSKTSDLRKGVLSRKGGRLFVGGEPWSSSNEEQTALLRKAGFKPLQSGKFSKVGLNSQLKSHGYIPNFANPLSDAIGREREAGIPVSQIRVGTHPALMNKGNPIGLGVTNTRDEPNGLKDVFGAKGYVPNYVDMSSARDFSAIQPPWSQQKSKEFNKAMDGFISEFNKGKINFSDLQNKTRKLGADMNMNSNSINRIVASQDGLNTTIAKAKRTYTQMSQKVQAFNNSAVGRTLSGGAGMGLMMGAPMLAGFLQGGSEGETAQERIQRMQGGSYAAGGALMGAGTGAAMGMMFGPLGTAIGAVGGALYGLANSAKEASAAQQEFAKAQTEASIQTGAALAQSLAPSLAKTNFGKGGLVEFSFGGKQRKIDVDDFNKLSAIDPSKSGGFGMRLGDFRSKMLGALNLDMQDILRRGAGSPSAISGILKESGINVSRGQLDAAVYTGKMIKGEDQGDVIQVRERRSSEEQIKKIEDQILAQMGTAARPAAIKAALDQLPQDMKIQTKALAEKGSTAGGRSFKKGDLEYFTPEELKRQIDEGNITEIAKTYEDILKQVEVQRNLNAEHNKGVILQLNFQKAMLSAQQAAKMEQLEIQETYAKQNQTLRLEQKLMGSSITERQRAMYNYTESINKAAETFKKGAKRIDSEMKIGLMSQIKGDKSLISVFKTRLADKGSDLTEQQLTSKLEGMSANQIIETLKRIKKAEQRQGVNTSYIDELLENILQKRKDDLAVLEKTRDTSKDLAESEKGVNLTLAGRKETLADMQRINEMNSRALQSTQKIRGFDNQVGAAQRALDFGPGYKTQQEREAFSLREKQFALDEKIKRLRENEQNEMAKLNARPEILDQKTFERYQRKKAAHQKTYQGGGVYGSDLDMTESEIAQYETLLKTENERKKGLEDIAQKKKILNEETEREISSSEELLKKERERLAIARAYRTGPGAFGNAFTDASKKMLEDAETLDYQLGTITANHFRDGLVSAMDAALDRSKDLGDVLQNVAMGFLQAIQQAMLTAAANQIVGAFGIGKNNGGPIRAYSAGGGVPARVSNGEYLMSKQAVNKYGGSFMHNLNSRGKIPGFSAGGSTISVDSGRRYQSMPMSGFFYSGQAGNVGYEEDQQAIQQVMQERKRKEMERYQKKAKKRALIKQIFGTLASIGIGQLASKINFGGSNVGKNFGSATDEFGNITALGKQLGYSTDTPSGVSFGEDVYGQPISILPGNSLGGKINKYASGGYISGKSGIDQIPAMLSEGEYVIKASSARQLGKPMLDKINAGKFYEGGPVSNSSESSDPSSSSNNNNINITVNLSKGSGEMSESKSEEGEGSETEKLKQFGDKMKQQVVSVIIEEQRPGGLLEGTK